MARMKAALWFLLLCCTALNTVSAQFRVFNAALNKPAKMYPGGDRAYFRAENAVDGRVKGCSRENTAMTDAGWGAAWYVDLGQNYLVYDVIITPGDYDLTDFDIRLYKEEPLLGSQLDYKKCVANSVTVDKGATASVTCTGPVIGRFVSIYRWYNPTPMKYGITLCEVQVMAKEDHDEMSPTGKLGGPACHNLVSRPNASLYLQTVSPFAGYIQHGTLTSPSYPNPYSPGENCLWEFRTVSTDASALLFLRFVDLDVDCRGRSNLIILNGGDVVFAWCDRDEYGNPLFPNKQMSWNLTQVAFTVGPISRLQIKYNTDPLRANGLFHRGVYFTWFFTPYTKIWHYFLYPTYATPHPGTGLSYYLLSSPNLEWMRIPQNVENIDLLDLFVFFIVDTGLEDITQKVKLTIAVEALSGETPRNYICTSVIMEGTFDEYNNSQCYENDPITYHPRFHWSYVITKNGFILVYVKRKDVHYVFDFAFDLIDEPLLTSPSMIQLLDLDAPHPWHSGKRSPHSSLVNPIRYGGLHHRAVVYQTNVTYEATVDFYITKLVMSPSTACEERYVNIKVTSKLWTRQPSYTYCTPLAPDEVIHVPVTVTRANQLKITILGSQINSDEEVEITWRVTRRNDMSNAYCGKEFLNKAGVIYSPGYPDAYGRDVHCAWTIAQAVPGRQVKTVFQIVEMDMGGVDDLLYVYNRTHSFLVDLCHNKPGDIIQVDSIVGDPVHVAFRSKNSLRGGRFRIKYFANEGSTPDVKAGRSIDIVSSANYPAGYAPTSRWVYSLKDSSYGIRWLYIMDMSMGNNGTPNGNCPTDTFSINNLIYCNIGMRVEKELPSVPSTTVAEFRAGGYGVTGRGVMTYLAFNVTNFPTMKKDQFENDNFGWGDTHINEEKRFVFFYNTPGTLTIDTFQNTQTKIPDGDNCFNILEIEIAIDGKLHLVDFCYIREQEYFELILPSESLVVLHYKHVSGPGFKFRFNHAFAAAQPKQCENRTFSLSRSERLKVDHWFQGSTYPAKQDCIWTFKATETLLIDYTVKRMDINGQTQLAGCTGDKDYLLAFGEYYCGSDNSVRPMLGRQLNLAAGYRSFIKFHSNSDTLTGQGFQIEIATGPIW